MDAPREERFEVDFPVQLSWQFGNLVRRVSARCLELSPSGVRLETQDQIQRGTTVLVYSAHFGRMGFASVKTCSVSKMKYEIELYFSMPLQLGDPARRKILEGLIRNPAPVETAPEPERTLPGVLVMKKGY